MRYTAAVITHNRCASLLRTLDQLAGLPERPPVIVVDNASTDGTSEVIAGLPQVRAVYADGNLGAVARNVAVEHASTPYVAFCDDDTWWEPGAMDRAATLLDEHPALAVVTGRIIRQPAGREDPVVAEMRDSPLPRPPWLPGPALGSFMAGASMVRVSAFREAGGFSRRLWLDGEEELLATDLMNLGWHMCFADDVVVNHRPSPVRDTHRRRRRGIRNTLWSAWLRRPVGSALRHTAWLLRTVPRDLASTRAFAEALGGLGWVVRERAAVRDDVERRLRTLETSNRRSRHYVG